MAKSTQMFLKPLYLPQNAQCTKIDFTQCRRFTGDKVLDHAFFLGHRELYFLFIHDLNMFEANQKNNFVLCANSDILAYRQYLELFNLKDIKLYTCNEIKRINSTVNVPYKLTPVIDNRWRMKHRGLITQTFDYKKIILYSQRDSDTEVIYKFNDIEKWVAEGFIFINTATAPVLLTLNAVANADIVVCATFNDYCYAMYCKPGSNVYYIKQQTQSIDMLSGININYDTGSHLFNFETLPQFETFNCYKKITASDV